MYMSFRETEGFPGASAFWDLISLLYSPKLCVTYQGAIYLGVKENIVELYWDPTLEMKGRSFSQRGRLKPL